MDPTYHQHDDQMPGPKWGPMVLGSIFLHLLCFALFFFVPESISLSRPKDRIIYTVDLVEMPRMVGPKTEAPSGTTAPKPKGKKTSIAKTSSAKRIAVPQKKQKPLVVAKRTVKRKTKKKEKPKQSSARLIDQAISRIEKKVQSNKKDHLDEALTKLEKQYGEKADSVPTPDQSQGQSQGRGQGSGQPVMGLPIQLYRLEIEDMIKGNWSYPVALNGRADLEAVIVLLVRKNGRIEKKDFEKRSQNSLFDDSVLKAIERSDPLPPFPKGYNKTHEEFVITFNLLETETR